MRSRIAVILAVLASWNLSAQTGAPDTLIARAWLERAAALLDRPSPAAGDYIAALEACRIAAEFSPPNRSAKYLEAKLLMEGYAVDGREIMGPDLRGSLEALEASLDAPHDPRLPDLYPYRDVAEAWASLALRLRSYGEILRRYGDWPRGLRDHPPLIHAAGRAAYSLGYDEEAAALARRGESLTDEGTDPGDYETHPASFRALALAAGDAAALKSFNDAARRWGQELSAALEFYFLSGVLTEEVENFYRASSPDSAVLAALDLMRGGGDVQKLERVFSSPLGRDLTLIRRIRDIAYGDLAAAVDERMLSFTGELTADADYDGYPEESIVFSNGRPETRRLDRDQDSRDEWIIHYGSGGRPVRAALLDTVGDLSITWEEEAYPWVLSLTRSEGHRTLTFSFAPGGWTWDPFGDSPIWSFPEDPHWNRTELWPGSRRIVAEFADPVSGLNMKAVTLMSDGYPIRAMETREFHREGMGIRKQWMRELLYADGRIVAARRSFREDPKQAGTPLWELYERWENGRMVGVAWDPGMRGRPSYLRDWALEQALEIRVWDLEGDGWFDLRHFTYSDDSVDARTLFVGEAGPEDLLSWSVADWPPWEY